jgi:hypothetical protein
MVEKMNVQYLGKKFIAKGNKNGRDWVKYNALTKVKIGTKEWERTFICWGDMIDTMQEGEYYTYEYKEEPYNNKEGKPCKSRTIISITPTDNNDNEYKAKEQTKLAVPVQDISAIKVPDDVKLSAIIAMYFQKFQLAIQEGKEVPKPTLNHFIGTVIISENLNNPVIAKLKKSFTDAEINSQIM